MSETKVSSTRRPATALARWSAVLAVALLFTGSAATPADASGVGYSPGPGASYNTTQWRTNSRGSNWETMYVMGGGVHVAKANSCRYGLSVWYTNTAGQRKNIYRVNDGCTWSPAWWFSTPYFTAKRGTTVQATYRWDGTWYPGLTFRVQ
jgi:hypothetical protein